ncbi:hypothetical protein [Microbacterium sp. SLBN-146]|uniref:hypothetical protein n=1 Tax=Microbacterium sp. SLBN-146 TaxID=2768457 RepID=UPI00114D4EBB|nr:hypothetical protein [Microbacterium sp. SLBN-146]TQJ32495.1 hypothetical protein FBY39_3006 [Microbacterium sp. SLBN-146]
MSTFQVVGAWAVVVLSLVLSVAFPAIVHWRLSRPDTLREMWISSRRGSVVAGCILGAVVLAVSGGVMSVLAVAYPFLWGTVALIAGALVAVLIVFIRYVRYDPSEFLSQTSDSSDE